MGYRFLHRKGTWTYFNRESLKARVFQKEICPNWGVLGKKLEIMG